MECYGTYVGDNTYNILAGKSFVPTTEATNGLASWWGTGYEGLTDGLYDQESAGRFSNDFGAIMDATVDLGKNYSLNKLKFFVYKGEVASAGSDLKIEIYSNGTWTEKYSLTNAELASYLKTNDGTSLSGYAWLEFDMAGAKASQIRISSTGTMTDKTTTFYEVTCLVNA